MEHVPEIMTAISTVGFPIVACIIMYYINWKTQQIHREETQKIQEMHRDEMTKITEAIHNNTVALTKLVDNLEDVKR